MKLFKRKKQDIVDYAGPNNDDNYKGFKELRNVKKTIIITSLILAVIASLTIFFTCFLIDKDYETIDNYLNLPYPIQTDAEGQFTDKVDDYNVYYTIKANYSISAKVVEKKYYFPYKISNKLSRYDLGLVFGKLLDESLLSEITFKNTGHRSLQTTYFSSLPAKVGGNVGLYFSNTHVIHANDNVLKCLRNIKEGDYVKLDGYLVYVTYKNGKGTGTWNSSLTRTDRGDGACEVMYVKSVTWIKEK